MITSLFGPIVSEVPSRNTRWARSSALVVTFSSAFMSMPTRRTRCVPPGGRPIGSPSTTEATPTRAKAAGPGSANAKAADSNDRGSAILTVLVPTLETPQLIDAQRAPRYEAVFHTNYSRHDPPPPDENRSQPPKSTEKFAPTTFQRPLT